MLSEKIKSVKTIRDITTNERIIKDYEKGGKFTHDVNMLISAVAAGNDADIYRAAFVIVSNGITFHKGGKIAGIQSLDSTSECCFCESMRKNPDLICAYCYDHKQEQYRAGILSRHYLNMFVLSNVILPVEMLRLLPITSMYFRFNSSGDLANDIHAINYFNIAAAFPNVKFALWYKNVAAVNAAVDTVGKPENLTLIWSNPIIDNKANKTNAPVHSDYVFTVFTSPEKFPAQFNECNGKKCMECGFKCYAGSWNKDLIIAEQLRK